MKGIMVLLVLCLPTRADWVPWNFDLHTCPPGWSAEDWIFTDEGAICSFEAPGPGGEWEEGILSSPSAAIEVPAGCDSVVLDIDQEFSCCLPGPFDYACTYILYSLSGGEWTSFYSTMSNWSESFSTPVHQVVPAIPGETLGLRFVMLLYTGWSQPGTRSADWCLENLVLTFYGDGLALQQLTWGEIKAMQ